MSDTQTPEQTKKTRNLKPREFVLCRMEVKDGKRIWYEIDAPEIPEKDKNNRNAYKKAVRTALEGGKDVEKWNGRKFDVIATVEPFMFQAQVEEVTTRTVKIAEA